MAESSTNLTMKRISALFKDSGMSLDQLGQAMGYEGDVARKSAWQFLNKTEDPRLSMLEKFAGAMKVPVQELFDETKSSEASPQTVGSVGSVR